jgi:hypothetical protein
MSDKPADTPALRANLLRAKPVDFGLAATPERRHHRRRRARERSRVERKLLGVIEKLFPAFVAREVPVPVLIGAVSFAVFTYDVLRAARDTEERLRQKKSPLWPAYYIGQEIITALRLVTVKSTGH